MQNRSATFSLVAFLSGLVVFALVNGRIMPAPLALPGLVVAILAALAGVVFGHRGFAEARRTGARSALALGYLVLCYLLLIAVGAYTAALVMAIRTFS